MMTYDLLFVVLMILLSLAFLVRGDDDDQDQLSITVSTSNPQPGPDSAMHNSSLNYKPSYKNLSLGIEKGPGDDCKTGSNNRARTQARPRQPPTAQRMPPGYPNSGPYANNQTIQNSQSTFHNPNYPPPPGYPNAPPPSYNHGAYQPPPPSPYPIASGKM